MKVPIIKYASHFGLSLIMLAALIFESFVIAPIRFARNFMPGL
jgi:hypothetical protein